VGNKFADTFYFLLFHTFTWTQNMSDESDIKPVRKRNWLSAFSLSIVHLLAFGMLYLVVVQMNWSFQDFYKLVGTQLTPEFERITVISHFVAARTPIVLIVIAVDIFIVFRLARRSSRWTSAYSHAVLLLLGFTGFLWTARSVEPMASGAPGVGNRPVVNNVHASNIVAPTMGLLQSDEPSREPENAS
jgi:hypothetical protein